MEPSATLLSDISSSMSVFFPVPVLGNGDTDEPSVEIMASHPSHSAVQGAQDLSQQLDLATRDKEWGQPPFRGLMLVAESFQDLFDSAPIPRSTSQCEPAFSSPLRCDLCDQ